MKFIRSVASALRIVAVIAFFLIGLVGIAAEVVGFSRVLGISWFLSFMLAMFVTYIPLVGTAAATYGAHVAWGWSWLWTILFFIWPQVLWLLVMMVIWSTAAIGAGITHARR